MESLLGAWENLDELLNSCCGWSLVLALLRAKVTDCLLVGSGMLFCLTCFDRLLGRLSVIKLSAPIFGTSYAR